MNIRPAKPEDALGIWRVHTSAIRELCREHYTEEEIRVWAEKRNVDSYRRVPKDTIRLVAENEARQIVGYGQINIGSAEIEGIYVSPAEVRKGVGKSLMKGLEAIAKEQGLTQLQLLSTLNAVGFYHTCKFKVLGEDTHRVTLSVSLRCIKMEKPL